MNILVYLSLHTGVFISVLESSKSGIPLPKDIYLFLDFTNLLSKTIVAIHSKQQVRQNSFLSLVTRLHVRSFCHSDRSKIILCCLDLPLPIS